MKKGTIFQCKGFPFAKDLDVEYERIIKDVPIKNALYGVLPEGLSFYASPRFDEFSKSLYCAYVYGDNTGWKIAKKGHIAQIAELIARSKDSLHLEHFRKGGKTLPDEKLKERKEWAKEASNPDCIRIFKHNPNRSSMPKMEKAYMEAGRNIYGKYIDTGKKRPVHVSTKMVEYMDGNGSGLRPLDTQVFIGSGQKIRFAKAGRF